MLFVLVCGVASHDTCTSIGVLYTFILLPPFVSVHVCLYLEATVSQS